MRTSSNFAYFCKLVHEEYFCVKIYCITYTHSHDSVLPTKPGRRRLVMEELLFWDLCSKPSWHSYKYNQELKKKQVVESEQQQLSSQF